MKEAMGHVIAKIILKIIEHIVGPEALGTFLGWVMIVVFGFLFIIFIIRFTFSLYGVYRREEGALRGVRDTLLLPFPVRKFRVS